MPDTRRRKKPKPTSDAVLYICHSCEAEKGGSHRTIIEPGQSAEGFLRAHQDCIRHGWGNRL